MSVGEFDDRLHSLCAAAGVDPPVEQVEQLYRYFELLRHWNRRINLTALRLDGYPPQTIDRLLVEPLVAATILEDAPLVCLDLGSGGGSPAIPLKIARPHLNLTMVEARGRKAAFLREAVRELGLRDTAVLAGRFDELLPDWEGRADLVTLRAVRVDASLEALIGRLLGREGRVLAFGTSTALSSFAPVGDLTLPGGGTLRILTPRTR